jgi:hypothetical protein
VKKEERKMTSLHHPAHGSLAFFVPEVSFLIQPKVSLINNWKPTRTSYNGISLFVFPILYLSLVLWTERRK